MLGSGVRYSDVPPSTLGYNSWKASEPATSLYGQSEDKVMLKVMSGDAAHPLRIVSLPVTIGRPTNSSGLTANPNNGFFTNSLLSRKHAMISMQNKHLWITDLGSSNGTYLNGILLKPHTQYRLNEGDLVQIGVDDGFDLSKQEQLLVVQVKLCQSKSNLPSELMETKKTFSPGRILQEARSMLSRSNTKLPMGNSSASLYDMHQSSRYEFSTSHVRLNAVDSRAAFELSSGLIALAQRLVETAESAKIEHIPPIAALNDLSQNVEASLYQYRSHLGHHTDDSESTFFHRPNLHDAKNIIRTYEFIFCIIASLMAMYLFL